MSGVGIGVGMEESPLDKISWSDFVYSMSVGMGDGLVIYG
jgi:hypothetical protein